MNTTTEVTPRLQSTNSRPKAKPPTRVSQVKGSLQRLYSSLSRDRSVHGKGRTVLQKRNSSDSKKDDIATYNDSRFRPIMSARQGLTGTRNTTGRYSKLKMPVIDAEAQAVTLTSPRTTEKVLYYQTANLPTLEKSKSA